MKKLKIVVISLMVVGAVVCFYTNNSSNKLQKHRRQSWLSQIGWNDRLSYSGKGIKIAVIDTGVDSTVSELNTAIIEEKRIVHTNENNDVAHGTAICGIIAGEAKDENQAMGIAKDSRIISIDVTDDENGIVQIEHLIKGLNYAIEKNVDIINISVGCLKESKELKSVINKAIDKDIIVIASGGNYMENNVLYPAQYDEVICIGAVDKDYNILSPKGVSNKKIIYFPGKNIVAPIGGNHYAGCDGTSFSTAICTGLAALLLEKNNDKSTLNDYLTGINFINDIDFCKIIKNYK